MEIWIYRNKGDLGEVSGFKRRKSRNQPTLVNISSLVCLTHTRIHTHFIMDKIHHSPGNCYLSHIWNKQTNKQTLGPYLSLELLFLSLKATSWPSICNQMQSCHCDPECFKTFLCIDFPFSKSHLASNSHYSCITPMFLPVFFSPWHQWARPRVTDLL